MSEYFESGRWNACVHRLDLGLYSHPKEFWENGVKTYINSKGKIPYTGKNSPQSRIERPNRLIKQDSEPSTLPTSCSGPRFSVSPYSVIDSRSKSSSGSDNLCLICRSASHTVRHPSFSQSVTDLRVTYQPVTQSDIHHSVSL